MGINIVENEEAGEDGDEPAKDEDDDIDPVDSSEENAPALETKKKETVDRTDDPVRMYLREMGAVELLSAARARSPSPSGSRPAATR